MAHQQIYETNSLLTMLGLIVKDVGVKNLCIVFEDKQLFIVE